MRVRGYKRRTSRRVGPYYRRGKRKNRSLSWRKDYKMDSQEPWEVEYRRR